jgi:hypothetical protein
LIISKDSPHEPSHAAGVKQTKYRKYQSNKTDIPLNLARIYRALLGQQNKQKF